MTKLCYLIYLNFLWLICSLPVITIGASTTALYYVSLKLARNEEGYIAKSFFKAFKQNFRQATIIWMLLLTLPIIIYFDYIFFQSGRDLLTIVGTVIVIILLLFYLICAIMVFPVLAKFNNTITGTVKNAIYMGIRHFYAVFLILFMVTTIALGMYINLVVRILGLAIGMSTICYASSFILNIILDKYVTET